MGNEENKIFDARGSRFRASGREALQQNVAMAFENARHAIVVYSPWLQPAQFNQSRVISALAKLCAGGRPNKVRILVEHSDETIRNNGRLTDLTQRFSDFIELRQLGDGSNAPTDTFVVFDRDGYIHQLDSDKADCIVDFNTSHEASALFKRFEQLWERSEPVAGLHVLGLGR